MEMGNVEGFVISVFFFLAASSDFLYAILSYYALILRGTHTTKEHTHTSHTQTKTRTILFPFYLILFFLTHTNNFFLCYDDNNINLFLL